MIVDCHGDVPLAGLASAMKEVGYKELPMLEIGRRG
jgi:hypothetical protein